MSETLGEILDDNGLCFGCGADNPIGLRLEFAWDGDTYFTDWTPQAAHQGWADRVHGGMLATVLDEVLSRAALTRHGLVWVTAELTTRMLRPARIGEPVRVSGRVVSVRPRLIICEGEITRRSDGTALAWGRAKMMRHR